MLECLFRGKDFHVLFCEYGRCYGSKARERRYHFSSFQKNFVLKMVKATKQDVKKSKAVDSEKTSINKVKKKTLKSKPKEGSPSSKQTPVKEKKIKEGRTLKVSKWEEECRKSMDSPSPLPKRNSKDELVFDDYPEMRPNMTPKEVLQAGSFGGTYFRPIQSSVTGEKYSGVWKELPKDWLEGLSIAKQIASSTYHTDVNTYKVKCGGSLEMWESSGWIANQDPYGWFQWYCRFYLGRRTSDDERQISRWKKCAGVKGRWRNNLIAKCVRSGCGFDNTAISPVVRQTLQHWGYRLTKSDFDKGAKRVK